MTVVLGVLSVVVLSPMGTVLGATVELGPPALVVVVVGSTSEVRTSMALISGFSVSCQNAICRPFPSMTVAIAERTTATPLPPADAT